MYTACAPKNYQWIGDFGPGYSEEYIDKTDQLWDPSKKNSDIYIDIKNRDNTAYIRLEPGWDYDYKEISKYKNILIIDYFDTAKKYKKTIIKVFGDPDIKFEINKELPEHKRFLETFHIQKR